MSWFSFDSCSFSSTLSTLLLLSLSSALPFLHFAVSIKYSARSLIRHFVRWNNIHTACPVYIFDCPSECVCVCLCFHYFVYVDFTFQILPISNWLSSISVDWILAHSVVLFAILGWLFPFQSFVFFSFFYFVAFCVMIQFESMTRSHSSSQQQQKPQYFTVIAIILLLKLAWASLFLFFLFVFFPISLLVKRFFVYIPCKLKTRWSCIVLLEWY